MGIKGDFSGLDNFIRKLNQEIVQKNVHRTISNAIAEDFVEKVKEGFSESHDPFGNSWANLRYRDGQPLRDSGNLASSFEPKNVSAEGFQLGTDREYGVHHQFGAPKANIVARPMLPPNGKLPKEWGEAAQEIAAEVMHEAFGK